MNVFAEIKWNDLRLPGFLDDDYIRENSVTYKFLSDRLKVPKHLQWNRRPTSEDEEEGEDDDNGHSGPDSESIVDETFQEKPRQKRRHVDLDAPAEGNVTPLRQKRRHVDLDAPAEGDDAPSHKFHSKQHIAGLVPALPFPKHSAISKQEHALFITLHSKFMHKKLTLASNVSSEEQREYCTYVDLCNKVTAEREEFLNFLKDHWKSHATKHNRLPTDVERYTTDSWRHRIKTRLAPYMNYYNKLKSIPLMYQGNKADIRLLPGDILLQLGTIPYVVNPKFKNRVAINQDCIKLSKHYPCNCEKPDIDTTNTIYKLPVSEDRNAQQLALAYDADIVISSSGLKAIANNHSTFQKSWDIPIVVRDYESSDSTGSVKKKVIYVDKPLPLRSMDVVERNERFAKLGVKAIWCQPKHRLSFNFPYQQKLNVMSKEIKNVEEPGKSSTETSEESCDEDDISIADFKNIINSVSKAKLTARNLGPPNEKRVTKVNADKVVEESEETFLNPAPYTNVSYRLWTMKKDKGTKEELPRHMLKQPNTVVDKELRILVRNKQDGIKRVMRPETTLVPVTILPKLEYQSEFGGEKMTRTELTNEWLALMFRQGSILTRARVGAASSEVLLMESRSLEQLTQEAKLTQGHSFVSDITSTLYSVLCSLKDLAPGQYLLSHTNAMQAFAVVMKANSEFGTMNLKELYENVKPEEVSPAGELPWIEVDTSLTMPYHAVFSRVPGTFYPVTHVRKSNAAVRSPKKKHGGSPSKNTLPNKKKKKKGIRKRTGRKPDK